MRRRDFLILLLSAILALSSAPIAFAQGGTGTNLVLDPPTIAGKPGDTVTLTIKAIPNNQNFVAMDVFLNFDPEFLEVVDADPAKSGVQVTPGDTLTVRMQNNVENQLGEIAYSAGLPMGMEYTSNDPVTVATVTFKINAESSGQASVTFNTTSPRETKVAYEGASVWGSLTGAGVGVNTTPEPVETIVKPEPPPPPPAQPPAAEPKPTLPPEPQTTPVTTPAPAPSPAPAPATKPPAATTPSPATAPAPSTTPAPAPAPATTPSPAPNPLPAKPLQPLGLAWWIWVIIGIVVVAIVARIAIWQINKPR